MAPPLAFDTVDQQIYLQPLEHSVDQFIYCNMSPGVSPFGGFGSGAAISHKFLSRSDAPKQEFDTLHVDCQSGYNLLMRTQDAESLKHLTYRNEEQKLVQGEERPSVKLEEEHHLWRRSVEQPAYCNLTEYADDHGYDDLAYENGSCGSPKFMIGSSLDGKAELVCVDDDDYGGWTNDEDGADINMVAVDGFSGAWPNTTASDELRADYYFPPLNDGAVDENAVQNMKCHRRASPDSVLDQIDTGTEYGWGEAQNAGVSYGVQMEEYDKKVTFRQHVERAMSCLVGRGKAQLKQDQGGGGEEEEEEEEENADRQQFGGIEKEPWAEGEGDESYGRYGKARDDAGQVGLLQSLFTCAEAVACRDARHAASLLQRIKGMASPHGDSFQRVASCFVEGLLERLDLQLAPPPARSSCTNSTTSPDYRGSQAMMRSTGPAAHAETTGSCADLMRQQAFLLMYHVCPYVAFGHFVANCAIFEAMEDEEAIHVIDLGMEQELQWVPFIDELAARAGGAPRLLRLTGVGPSKPRMEEIGKVLRAQARAASLEFEFEAVAMSMESLAAEGAPEAVLGIRGGEAVAVNSVLQLHCVVKESRGSLNAVLRAIHRLSPKVLTLVEQDVNHNGPFFLGRFLEALQYYCSIFDSLQAVLPRYDTRRIRIEQFYLGHEIRNIVAREGSARVERHERVEQWRRRMSRAGFLPSPLRMAASARLWLGRFYASNDYTLSDDKGCLVLGWKCKPIVAASAWRC